MLLKRSLPLEWIPKSPAGSCNTFPDSGIKTLVYLQLKSIILYLYSGVIKAYLS